ncbi:MULTISPECIES: putative urea ABC transporter substrate-binding protein [Bradyrhizobium]|jgi:NitT/TauT family transport system substrate-binding protein|uniref:putative urea ABC transporter substrate-binding protein n=1 Tax=Bradyrhizobium TaxID=374 RepID=UPI000480D2F6|nr:MULTISPECIES: putative urea ABC transporter substrate-binding protein [Bradyrhizobium]MCS3452973.1 NitT/TauT family transport system substrate-binding protein [Bradyrhizobium elkanii]MCS3564921.1 NitT/TauT family transport system substrate-binding protein [Bradyrhizobium elkanii]MCW2145249.1 NitT/TauT family transport system substrate-binding protein [Bradyrhizobium elkanii]MCW2355933.1 NitT/TauT family transport system substrate-binding protein [Bradyrhizobium elkanii]MCW2378076.1 NitT/Tau
MNKFVFFLRSVVIGCAVALAAAPAADAAPKKSFKVAWSIYVGWMPWGYAADTGIVKKWADKYGIAIEVKQFNDYVESINQYTVGGYDAVTITNMDALSIPAAGGVDTTAVVMGDFSNGNDAVILKNKSGLADIKGQTVNLVEFSVSHYLLARALETSKLSEKDVKVVNTSDADIAAAYKTPDVSAVVTWNPIVTEILGSPDAKKVFDSSQIPGEIMDLMVVNTAVAKDNPDFAKALVGIWYETLSKMTADDPAAKAAKEAMAKASGTDLAGFDSQLSTTKLFDKATDAEAFTRSQTVGVTMDRVRKFLFEKDLLGKGAKSADAVGIELADKSVLGDKANVKLRFDPTYMDEAAKGKL